MLGKQRAQLEHFAKAPSHSFHNGMALRAPSTWELAFGELAQSIESLPVDGKPVTVFFDEAPWLDSRRSGFLDALEYFWNTGGPYCKIEDVCLRFRRRPDDTRRKHPGTLPVRRVRNFRAQAGSSFNRFAFTGHESDNETGLYYFKARYYEAYPWAHEGMVPHRHTGYDLKKIIQGTNSYDGKCV